MRRRQARERLTARALGDTAGPVRERIALERNTGHSLAEGARNLQVHAQIVIALDGYRHLMPGSEEAAGMLDASLDRADTQARVARLAV